MADELKVTVWRFTLPELYQANCLGLRDPTARNGHYHSAPHRSNEEGLMGLHEAALKMAAANPDHRYLDAQAWEGPDEVFWQGQLRYVCAFGQIRYGCRSGPTVRMMTDQTLE